MLWSESALSKTQGRVYSSLASGYHKLSLDYGGPECCSLPTPGPWESRLLFFLSSQLHPLFSKQCLLRNHKLGDCSDVESISITVGEDLGVTDSRMYWVAEHRPDSPRSSLFPSPSAGACWSSGQPPSILGIVLTSTSRTRRSFTLKSLGLQGNGSPFLPGPSLLGSNAKASVSLVPPGWSSESLTSPCFLPAFPLTQVLGVLFGIPCRNIRWCGFLWTFISSQAHGSMGIITAYLFTRPPSARDCW